MLLSQLTRNQRKMFVLSACAFPHLVLVICTGTSIFLFTVWFIAQFVSVAFAWSKYFGFGFYLLFTTDKNLWIEDY